MDSTPELSIGCPVVVLKGLYRGLTGTLEKHIPPHVFIRLDILGKHRKAVQVNIAEVAHLNSLEAKRR